ncbi:P-loop ATPase, Sll1717 family [Brucella sp.]|uniref:P-loop ATPase, Sll1717 family n=1 Tax=Brucella sp. TaxID=52132 RepID=UPI0028AFE24F|nr:hypothetical protein [Brucella sp.]
MPKFVTALGLKGNPFENYVAEKEPDIAEYAVKPPYFEVIEGRAMNTSSFLLFGERGAGKSATRLTIYKEIWKLKGSGKKVPLAVNMVDFSCAINKRSFENLNENTLISEVAFLVIESLLAWLSTLEEDERSIFLHALDDDEKNLCYQLLRDFYLSRPDSKREKSAHDAMELFNQAILAKTQMWITRKWDRIAELMGACADVLAKRAAPEADVSGSVTKALKAEPGDFDAVLVLKKLVSLVSIFDFSGIIILVDKVDETDATNNSAERTAELIHPILSRIQFTEVNSFSWIFFLWHQTKSIFESDKFPVRLDKLGHATVSWDDKFFQVMLNRRVKFFSDDKKNFIELFSTDTDEHSLINLLISISMRSPREMIRLLDVIIREHDVVYAENAEYTELTLNSIQAGIDKYVTDTISTVYGERLLAQIFRLNKLTFTNKDVQNTFRVGAQSARTRIQSWESAGIIKHIGTRAAEGVQGGKPANEYSIVDARIERVMARQLIKYEGEVVAENDEELEKTDCQ